MEPSSPFLGAHLISVVDGVAMPKNKNALLIVTLTLIPTLAYGQYRSAPIADRDAGSLAKSLESTGNVFATVNGVKIGEADVRLALSASGHDKNKTPEHQKNLLRRMIQRELVRQRAVELGLDVSSRYREKLARMEARINAFKRQELSELFWRETARNARVGDAEARKYFTDNATRIRTELHVWQLLWRKKSQAERALSDLRQGASFEEVARKRFPKLPQAAGVPWELGYLKWKQVPKPWWDIVYDLKRGEVSGIIQGPNNRFWIIKLIDNRQDRDITFESSKAIITEVLKSEKVEKLREQINRDLRAQATIVHLRDPQVELFDEEE